MYHRMRCSYSAWSMVVCASALHHATTTNEGVYGVRAFAPPVRTHQVRSPGDTWVGGRPISPQQKLSHVQRPPYHANVELRLSSETEIKQEVLIGDDSAYFALEEQKLDSWVKFSAATGFVLLSLSYLWFIPGGPAWGDVFLEGTQAAIGTTDPAATIFAMLSIFAVAHSGLAGLRPYAEDIVGARAWRVFFACVSLPLALSCLSYFINHAHDGTVLWDITNVPGVHTLFFVTNFISFLFLSPSTFNLLEIAAIDKPQLHLWETGIIRITRHPQAVGQVLWCAAHTAWLGTTTAVAASTILCLHHAFATWHGDRRLEQRHGETFEAIKATTSIIPFQAILDGRQQLPDDYWKEFVRGPYALVVIGTTLAYFAHPYMQAGAALLHW